MVWRHRRQWVPPVALLAVWAGAHAAAVSPPGRVVLLTALTVGAVGVVVWPRSRTVTARRMTAVSTAVPVVWWLAATFTGNPLSGPGVTAGAVLVVGWWWRHRTRPVPAPQAPSLPLPTLLELWEARIATRDGALAGSSLTELDVTHGRVSATVNVTPGRGTTGDVINARPKVASALELPEDRVVILPPADRVSCRARLTVLPVADAVEMATDWTRPSLTPAGVMTFGPYADRGHASIRLWRTGEGVLHCMVCGGTGSGKSHHLQVQIIEVAASGLGVNLIGDPKGGRSWAPIVGLAARSETSVAGCVALLVDVEREMVNRQTRYAAREWIDDQGVTRTGWTWEPTPDEPLLNVVIDEAHRVLRDMTARLAAERIAQEGRDTGVRLVIGTQVPSQAQLGGSRILRTQLAMGSVVVLRTTDDITGGKVLPTHFEVDPRSIPIETPGGESTAGTGYVHGPGATRPVQARGLRIPDAFAVADGITPIPWSPRAVDVAELPGGPDPEPATTGDPVRPVDGTVRDRVAAIITIGGEHSPGSLCLAMPDVSLSAVKQGIRVLVESGTVERVGHGAYRARNAKETA